MSQNISPKFLFQGVAAGVGDMGTSWVSAGTDLKATDNYSVQVIYPAAWNGTFTFEASNDSTDGATDGHWNTYAPDAAFPASDAGAGQFIAKATNFAARWLRMRFVRTSGSGLANGVQCGKGY